MPRKLKVIVKVGMTFFPDDGYININFSLAPWTARDSISSLAGRVASGITGARTSSAATARNLDDADRLEALIKRIVALVSNRDNLELLHMPMADSAAAFGPLGLFANSTAYLRVRNDASVQQLQDLFVREGLNIELVKFINYGTGETVAVTPATTMREIAGLPANYLAPRPPLTAAGRRAMIDRLNAILGVIGAYDESDSEEQARSAPVGHRDCDRDFHAAGYPEQANLLAALKALPKHENGEFTPLTGSDPVSLRGMTTAGKILAVLVQLPEPVDPDEVRLPENSYVIRLYDNEVYPITADGQSEAVTMIDWMDKAGKVTDPQRGTVVGRAAFNTFDEFKHWAHEYLERNAPRQSAPGAGSSPSPRQGM